jgi:uncharacterized protein DUF5658
MVRGPRTLGGMTVSRDHEPAPPGTAPAPLEERRVAQADRRALTLRTLIASGFSPRRRTGRRAGDHELPVDFHDRRLLVPVAAMLLLSIADGFLTLTLLGDGAEEANPLLAFLLTKHPALFAAAKMGMTGLGTVVLVVLARARVFQVVRVSLFLYGLAAVYFVLVAYETWLVGLML